jgi:hypothetical protein
MMVSLPLSVGDLKSAIRWTMASHEGCAKKHSFPESNFLSGEQINNFSGSSWM